MYVGHTNALTAVLVILPARWAGVALQPLSVPFGPAGITHACRHNLDVPKGYIYKANTCAGPQKRCSFRSRYLHGTSSSRFERRARAGKKANFQIRMKYSGWSQPGMRRECTRMYGAASMRMAIFKCGSTDRNSSSSVVVHSVSCFCNPGGWKMETQKLADVKLLRAIWASQCSSSRIEGEDTRLPENSRCIW
jgi:hypothetical protein